ncbi:MAG: hypothetical protein QOK15_1818, partial [Nocardioidaceae bacterium]|nr:hypothetical protein [Nocardioidaceae bacterium]
MVVAQAWAPADDSGHASGRVFG